MSVVQGIVQQCNHCIKKQYPRTPKCAIQSMQGQVIGGPRQYSHGGPHKHFGVTTTLAMHQVAPCYRLCALHNIFHKCFDLMTADCGYASLPQRGNTQNECGVRLHVPSVVGPHPTRLRIVIVHIPCRHRATSRVCMDGGDGCPAEKQNIPPPQWSDHSCQVLGSTCISERKAQVGGGKTYKLHTFFHGVNHKHFFLA